MGVAIGAVVHSQVAALVGTLVWIFVVENLLVGLLGLLDSEGVDRVPPLPRARRRRRHRRRQPALLLAGASPSRCGWIALLGAAGVVRTRRRDIT